MTYGELRRELPPWIRSAFDIIMFVLAGPGVQDLGKTWSIDVLEAFVAGVINRLNPYKAPEEYAGAAKRITSFLWGDLHSHE